MMETQKHVFKNGIACRFWCVFVTFGKCTSTGAWRGVGCVSGVVTILKREVMHDGS